MKYYQGSVVSPSHINTTYKCSECGKSKLSYKIREDRELICTSCWFKDKEAEDIEGNGNVKFNS